MFKPVIDPTTVCTYDSIALGIKLLEDEFKEQFNIEEKSFCRCRFEPYRLSDKYSSGDDIKYHYELGNPEKKNESVLQYMNNKLERYDIEIIIRQELDFIQTYDPKQKRPQRKYRIHLLNNASGCRLLRREIKKIDAKAKGGDLHLVGFIYKSFATLFHVIFEPSIAAIWIALFTYYYSSKEWENTSEDYDKEITDNIYNLLRSLLIFKLTFDLQNGFSRNVEMKQLFEALTGDVKAMAMYFETLTYDQEKYYKDNKKVILKEAVKNQYKRVGILLGAIPSTAMYVLRGQTVWCCFKRKRPIRFKEGHRVPFSLDKKPRSCCVNKYSNKRCITLDWGKFFPCFERVEVDEDYIIIGLFTEVNVDEISDRDWYDENQKKIKQLWKKSTGVRKSVYNKLKFLRQSTDMDLFECEMTMLLDELTRCAENGLGFGNGPVQKTFHAKWQDIYGSWGKMSSLKTYREPGVLILFKVAIFMLYACFMPYNYRGSAWYSHFVITDICIVISLWVVAFYIRNPFKTTLGASGVEDVAKGAAKQISRLMYNKTHEKLETTEYKDGGFLKTVHAIEFKFDDTYKHVDSNQIYPVESIIQRIYKAEAERKRKEVIDEAIQTGEVELTLEFIQKLKDIGIDKSITNGLYKKYIDRNPGTKARVSFRDELGMKCAGITVYFHMTGDKFDAQLYGFDNGKFKIKKEPLSGGWSFTNLDEKDFMCATYENFKRIEEYMRDTPQSEVWKVIEMFLKEMNSLGKKPTYQRWTVAASNRNKAAEKRNELYNETIHVDTLIF